MRASSKPATVIGAALAAPAAILLFALLLLPSFGVLLLSLTDYRFGDRGFDWIGTANFAALATDDAMRNTIRNTFVYVGLVAPISIFGALWIALLLEREARLGGLFRTILFLPITATLVAMATAWEVVLHPTFGMANIALAGLGLDRVRFLTDPQTALPTLAFIGIWKTLGYNVVLFLAGLATVDRQLYEAAAIDGADAGWRRFSLVTWPQLLPVTVFVTVVTLIRAFSEFESVAVLTKGGPSGATDLVLYTLYQEAFRYFDIGLAAALDVVFLVFVAALSILQVIVSDRQVRR